MWKMNKDGLIHMTDESRKLFRTSVSKSVLDRLNELAIENDTFPNYILENGLRKLLIKNDLVFNKSNRPKDRIQYNTTYDENLLEDVRTFAKEKGMNINDVLEASIQYVEMEKVKKYRHRYRIEP